MRIRNKVSGEVLEASVRLDLPHTTYGYPMLAARAGADRFLIPWLEAPLYELLAVTEDELRELTEAGYYLERAEPR